LRSSEPSLERPQLTGCRFFGRPEIIGRQTESGAELDEVGHDRVRPPPGTYRDQHRFAGRPFDRSGGREGRSTDRRERGGCAGQGLEINLNTLARCTSQADADRSINEA